ncbi:single-stranded DNA-binding protein [Parafrankia sp. FMc2]|uniref:single-stranded DNA-binding protein n=1 Tax=Parafrankia sp. FMc2 TaxID=3233196 RepID=UPI0034D6B7AA
MAGEPIVTIIGNLTNDVELRFTPNGAAVASFTVASTPRVKKGDEYVDGQALFLRCSIWRQAAENLAASDLTKGSRVIVQGRLKQRNFEDREGQKRTVIELDVDEIGPSLKYATAKVTKTERGQGGGFAGQNGGGQNGAARQAAPAAARGGAADDPWSMAPGGYSGDEPPF